MSSVYDFAVIGGGVVGAGVLRALTLGGASCLLLEKADELLDGASKANSAIMHTGFDAVPGSVEAKAVALGYREYMDIHGKFELPEPQFGALMVAYEEEEEAALAGVKTRAMENGVDDVEIVGPSFISKMEPHLREGYRKAIWVKGEAVIDPWSAPLAYFEMALINGATILRNAEVTALDFDGQQWRIETAAGSFLARHIVNAAGLYGDKIDAMALGEASFSIRPRKGQFLVLDKAASQLINTIQLAVPNEMTKGILISKTAFGNVIVGPTAEPQVNRSQAHIDPDVQTMLHQFAIRKIPAFRDIEITAHYCGLRPATDKKDYHIIFKPDLNYTCLGGIRSTGLSSSLGLGIMVAEKLLNGDGLEDPVWPRANQIAQNAKRDFQMNDNGGVVCHCEWVTRREIEAALNSSIPPSSLAGLKRATRVSMGRCQGFYCTSMLAKMTDGKFGQPIACPHPEKSKQGLKQGDGD